MSNYEGKAHNEPSLFYWLFHSAIELALMALFASLMAYALVGWWTIGDIHEPEFRPAYQELRYRQALQHPQADRRERQRQRDDGRSTRTGSR